MLSVSAFSLSILHSLWPHSCTPDAPVIMMTVASTLSADKKHPLGSYTLLSIPHFSLSICLALPLFFHPLSFFLYRSLCIQSLGVWQLSVYWDLLFLKERKKNNLLPIASSILSSIASHCWILISANLLKRCWFMFCNSSSDSCISSCNSNRRFILRHLFWYLIVTTHCTNNNYGNNSFTMTYMTEIGTFLYNFTSCLFLLFY